jgi:hypothetical protein
MGTLIVITMFRHILLIAISMMAMGNLSAALVTETHASIARGGQRPCEDRGTSSSHCEAEYYDPSTGTDRAEASAQASYGSLSVTFLRSSDSDIHRWTDAWAVASFSDVITIFGSDLIRDAELHWDISDLVCWGGCDVGTAEFEFLTGVIGNKFDVYASIGLGDPFYGTSTLSESLQLLSISLLDLQLNQVRGVSFSSRSGAIYNIEGATQVFVPEPNTGLTAVFALLLLIRRGLTVEGQE